MNFLIGCEFVATTRKDNEALDSFQSLESYFELKADDEKNLIDVEEYVRQHLKNPAFHQELNRVARDANLGSLEEKVIKKLVNHR